MIYVKTVISNRRQLPSTLEWTQLYIGAMKRAFGASLWM